MIGLIGSTYTALPVSSSKPVKVTLKVPWPVTTFEGGH